jgi:cobalt-zinc-cadmium efflux system outer membrane protein
MAAHQFFSICAVLSVLACGCAAPPSGCEHADVASRVACRTGVAPGQPGPCGEIVFPNGASLSDGLTEDEAVLIALWNNAAFHELLADLDIANGDLVQAGLLPNPEVAYFFPVSEKPYKYAIDFPIEALWLRPIKIAAAESETARVCERLTQAALDLIRDVRQAYADALLARGRLRVVEEAVQIRGQIARLADARLNAGDISAQESATARIDSLQSQQDVARAGYDVSLADERLRHLLGIGMDRTPLRLDDLPPPLRADLDVETLTAEAIASRPDALAVEHLVWAASERLRLSRLNWVRFLGILDATSGQDTGHEFGPAFRVTLPIFNFNEGNIERAEGELTKAERQRQTIRNQIVLDVRAAHFRYTQARTESEFLDQKVRPEVEAAIRRAEAAYREGNTSYVVTLETTRQLLDSRLRQEQLRAELRRAWAELERSVGRRLDGQTPANVTKPIP